MSGTDGYPLPSGSGRLLMLGTSVPAAAAAVVLVLGTHDARLLRLGLVAALWAALLGAFAAARIRRETRSCVERADQLRAVYQLELEREVAARREHTLTVERELREQAELSQRREIVELRADLAAMRANLEQLLGGNSPVERVTLRAESTRLLPLPAHPRTFDDNHSPDTTAAAVGKATPSVTGPELRFGPGRPQAPTWGCAASPADAGFSNGAISNRGSSNGSSSNGLGRHGVPSREWSGSNGNTNGSHTNGSHTNGSHTNGSHTNGGGARWSPDGTPTAAATQRTVNDLLAAHGVASLPRRRHSQEDTPPTK